MDHTRCGRCKRVLLNSMFQPSNRGRDGTYCRDCYRERAREKSRGAVSPSRSHPSRSCQLCGALFAPKLASARYCSGLCVSRARPPRDRSARSSAEKALRLAAKQDRTCVFCGAVMPRTMRSNAKFCSEQCNSRAHAITNKAHRRTGRKSRGDHALISVAYLGDRDGWHCEICNKPINRQRTHPDPQRASVDHIIPVSLGGGNELANLRVVHLRCNSSRRATATNDQLRLIG